MANEENKNLRKKQMKLPVIRQAEALESLTFLWLQGQAYIQGNDAEHDAELAARRQFHLKQLTEYAQLVGVADESDLVPF